MASVRICSSVGMANALCRPFCRQDSRQAIARIIEMSPTRPVA